MQPFNFINPTSEDARERNLRELEKKSTFRVWTPALVGVGGSVTTAKAYAQLYGSMCYYWVEFTGTNLVYSGPGTSKITGVPYGPTSTSGVKTTYDTQYLHYYDGTDLGVVTLAYSSSVPHIVLNAYPVANRSFIRVWGWIVRD